MTTNETVQDAPEQARSIRDGLVAFLEAKTKQTVETDQDLFGSGLVTSMFAMELVVHLENTYDIEIAGPDLKLTNFRSVDNMTELTLRLKAEDGG